VFSPATTARPTQSIATDFPPAITGHNSYWKWGPRDSTDGATTIAANLHRSYLGEL
jgi:hypothetical protein